MARTRAYAILILAGLFISTALTGCDWSNDPGDLIYIPVVK